VVDDDEDILKMIRWFLEREGFLVETATNGRDALARARERRPAVVVLDLLLPDLDGQQVATRLRDLYGAGLPILIMSASGRERKTAQEIGAVGYLGKPFELEALRTAVQWGQRTTRAGYRSQEAAAVAEAAEQVTAALRRAGVQSSVLRRVQELGKNLPGEPQP